MWNSGCLLLRIQIIKQKGILLYASLIHDDRIFAFTLWLFECWDWGISFAIVCLASLFRTMSDIHT
jgi:hypothetical protein